jgi:GIY-YIG catalytic domain/HB1, ASXL, restriction endonuclease HTH domain
MKQAHATGGKLSLAMSGLERQPYCSTAEVERALLALDGEPRRVPAADWPAGLDGLDEPGLYSWWVDEGGAAQLRSGLGYEIAGRIYSGQTGATKWPSGRVGSMTLRQRLGGNHLGGSIRGSTFRRTLAACLRESIGLSIAAPGRLARESEVELSAWMRRHLHVAVHPFPNRGALGALEHRVLAALDPPLNLEGMPSTAVRQRVSELRRILTLGEASLGAGCESPPADRAGRQRDPARGVTLHNEIAAILSHNGRPMTTAEIADAVNQRGFYIKRDETVVTAFQVHGRTRKYAQLFTREGQTVKLRSWP